jgi:ubiquinone/menaquinone biosynthesis C-methylase UbiE
MSSEPDAAGAKPTPPYSVLAVGYDVVMSHVDYELWAAYVHDLVTTHVEPAGDVLELGCGTGSFAFSFLRHGDYRYLATDVSETMIRVARRKAEMESIEAQFEQADFTNFWVDRPVDLVLLLYDGLNYLLEKEPIRRLLGCSYRALRPGGAFIVDQSTPSNSVNNEALFEDRDQVDDFSYVRRSRYDAATRLHRTTLQIQVGERRFTEEHLQRAYELDEIRSLIDEAGFHVEACYDGFSTLPADDASERAHWVLRRPTDTAT